MKNNLKNKYVLCFFDKPCQTTDSFCASQAYFVSERVLFQVVRLDELHATLAADVRPDVFVFHHVVLKLAWVLESFLALGTSARTTGTI